MRNLDVITNKNLREVYLGTWEGKTISSIIEKWGREAVEKDWLGNFGCFTFPDGEAIMSAGVRFHREVLEIAKENKGKTILIATHAAVIRAFWAIISNISPEMIVDNLPFATNASYSICLYQNEKIQPLKYSVDDHLMNVGITKVNLI